MRRHPNVVNVDEIEPWSPPGERPPPFAGSSKGLAKAAGAKQLGANHFRVPAGASAVPMHAHHGNEEALFMLEGQGTLRLGDARIPVRAGDYVALPAGDSHAHQLLADQGTAIAYLCISTQNPIDIITYPDSNKLLAQAIHASEPSLRKMFHAEDGNVGYFVGEGDKPA